jgi:hypothetical protein
LKTLEDHWSAAKKKFSGDEWAFTWTDWEKRLKAAKSKLPDNAKKP